jgi:hypothetical protein
MNIKLTQENEEEIIKLYLNGMSINEIGKLFNVCGGTIWYRLKNRSIKLRTIHETLIGNKRAKGKSPSLEVREKISLKLKNRIFSQEHRKKLSVSATGKKFSEEHRNHLSDAAIKRMKENPIGSVSKSETKFLNELEKILMIKFERQFLLENRLFDGKWKNMLVEIDCPFWHAGKQHENDILKNKIAKENGYKLFRYKCNRESEVETRILKYAKRIGKMRNYVDAKNS